MIYLNDPPLRTTLLNNLSGSATIFVCRTLVPSTPFQLVNTFLLGLLGFKSDSIWHFLYFRCFIAPKVWSRTRIYNTKGYPFIELAKTRGLVRYDLISSTAVWHYSSHLKPCPFSLLLEMVCISRLVRNESLYICEVSYTHRVVSKISWWRDLQPWFCSRLSRFSCVWQYNPEIYLR